jgi:hypothetical protein
LAPAGCKYLGELTNGGQYGPLLLPDQVKAPGDRLPARRIAANVVKLPKLWGLPD